MQEHKKEAAWHKATLAAIAKHTQAQQTQGAQGVLPAGASALTRSKKGGTTTNCGLRRMWQKATPG